MKRVIIFAFCASCCFLIPFVTFSQPGGDPGGGGNPTPITGIELLLIAGGAFGIKKLINNRKNKS